MCLDNFKTDPVLQTLFVPKTKAIKRVWQASENYVTEWLFNTQYYFYCVALLYIICLCLSLCLVWRINVFIKGIVSFLRTIFRQQIVSLVQCSASAQLFATPSRP